MQVFFVGGVHGSGKSLLCNKLSEPMAAVHVRASDLLDFSPQSGDETRKAVSDIVKNQARIIAALKGFEEPGRRLLLDGHYAVLHVSGSVVPIPISVFQGIDPVAMILVEDDPGEIVRRVQRRGEQGFDLDLITRLMTAERSNAEMVSGHIDIPLMHWQPRMGTDSALSFFLQWT